MTRPLGRHATGRTAFGHRDFASTTEVAPIASIATLVRSGGLNAIDVGGGERAREFEALGLLGIRLKSRLDTGFGTDWKLVLPEGSETLG